MTQSEELQALAAQHEAAHAIMRKLCGLPATRLSIGVPGEGLCEGDGRPSTPDAQMLIAFAGLTWEAGLGIGSSVDWAACRGGDIDAARELAQRHREALCYGPLTYGEPCSLTPGSTLPARTAEEILEYYFRKAADMLCPHSDLIEDMGAELAERKTLTAEEVTEMLRGVQPQMNGRR